MEGTAKERITLTEFIAKHGITMTCKRVDSNPINNADWGYGSRHWTCTFRYAGRRMSTPFSQGSAYKDEPKPAEVLGCIADDSATHANASQFEDWCSNYGWDADSRKAERIWKAIEKQAIKLEAFLGPDEYSELLWNTERDS